MSDLNRRDFFLAAGGVSLLAAAGAFRANAATRLGATRIAFSFGESRFPLVLAGESAKASERLRRVEFFMPLFGGERKVVNPAMPAIKGAEIRFDVPGEYYLLINKTEYLRVLALDPSEGTPKALLRMFDFFVANNLYSGVDDEVWYRDHSVFLRGFFRGCEPMMLSCGPSHQVFREWVRDRLALPTRIVTYVSARFRKGEVITASHNLPEVYLPELGKWVMLDLNSNLVPRWLDAMETSAAVKAKSNDEDEPLPDWQDFGIDLYSSVENSRFVDEVSLTELRGLRGTSSVPFEPQLVGEIPINLTRTLALRCFYGGAGYWGGEMRWAQPTGTEFLPGNKVLWASLLTNPVLMKATEEMYTATKLEFEIVDPAKLRTMLDAGHHEQIAARAWRRRYPVA